MTEGKKIEVMTEMMMKVERMKAMVMEGVMMRGHEER